MQESIHTPLERQTQSEEWELKVRMMRRLAKRFYSSPKSREESDYERWRLLYEDDFQGILNDRPDILERFRFEQHEEESLNEMEILLKTPSGQHCDIPN